MMNLLAGGLASLLLYSFFSSNRPLGFISCFLIFSWLLVNLLNLIPWYPGKKGKVGIRLHFQKNLVPSSYLLALSFLLKQVGVLEWLLIPFTILMLPIFYVSGILLWFHFRDRSILDPGYFSHNYYLNEETPPCIP